MGLISANKMRQTSMLYSLLQLFALFKWKCESVWKVIVCIFSFQHACFQTAQLAFQENPALCLFKAPFTASAGLQFSIKEQQVVSLSHRIQNSSGLTPVLYWKCVLRFLALLMLWFCVYITAVNPQCYSKMPRQVPTWPLPGKCLKGELCFCFFVALFQS